MARILDTFGRSARTQVAPEPAMIVDRPTRFDADAEANDVPFIEVGGPSARSVKPSPDRVPIPAIIPISRPAPRLPEPPSEASTTTESGFFQISFQPLPFAGAASGPLEQRIARGLVAFHHPDHPACLPYHAFADELETQLGSEPGKSLLFSSAHPSSGTTSVLLNLAVTLAQKRECRVAIVDAQFARPACAERLGTAASPGLREVLDRKVPLVWAIQETGLANLHLLANGKESIEPQMDVWPTILDQLRQRFDWVLIDAPDWGSRPEIPAMSASCAATYLVLRPEDLTGPDVNDLISEIPRQGGQFRGYVLAQR